MTIDVLTISTPLVSDAQTFNQKNTFILLLYQKTIIEWM